MATLITIEGASYEVKPKGEFFALEELQTAVCGYVEVVELDGDEAMVINEEGKLKRLPPNYEATKYAHEHGAGIATWDVIVGPALIVRTVLTRDGVEHV